MKPFRYERANDAFEAVALLSQEPAGAFLGGGTQSCRSHEIGRCSIAGPCRCLAPFFQPRRTPL